MRSALSFATLSIFISQFALAGETLTWAGCGITKTAFMAEMAAAYEKETGVKIDFKGGGATKGIRDVHTKNTTIGGTCRHIIPDPNEIDVVLWPVAWDALVVIAHPENPIDSMTADQVKNIFLGKVNLWSELGVKNSKPIEPFIRKGKISGVGLMARELVFGDTDVNFTGKIFDSTGPLERALEKAPNAVAFDGISSAKKIKVKILKINNIEPTVENISSGKYPLFRPLFLVTPKEPSPKVMDFVNFVRGPKGQDVIKSQGTVTLAQGSKLWAPYRHHMEITRGTNKGVFDQMNSDLAH